MFQLEMFRQVFKCPRCGKEWKCVEGETERDCHECHEMNDTCVARQTEERVFVNCDDCEIDEAVSRR